MVLAVTTVPTTPFKGQKPGTSGLRKPVSEVTQQNYVENFIQATLETVLGTFLGSHTILRMHYIATILY